MARPRSMSGDRDNGDDETPMQGRRTNVQFYMGDDLDAAFESAETPQNHDATNENHAPEVATSSKQIRFSLGSNVDDGEDLSLRGGILKIVRGSGQRASMSSADLSPVSTAPPSASRSVTQLEEVRYAQDSETDGPYQNETTSPMVRFPPHDDDDTITTELDDDNTEADDFVPPPPPESPERMEEEEEEMPTQVGTPHDFATQPDDDDDDDKEGEGFHMHVDDESESETESLKYPATRDGMADKSNPIVSQTLESPRAIGDESDNDSLRAVKKKDKKPKSPRAVDDGTLADTDSEDGSDNDSLKQRQPQKNNRKTRKSTEYDSNDDQQSRKKRRARNIDTSDDESLAVQTKADKKKKKQKSKTRSRAHASDDESVLAPKKKKKNQTQVSSRGYPLPRTYTAIPVSDVKVSPTESGLRRSRRAKIKPLEFWRNERIVYGPNDFDESFPEDLQDMPVPIQISKADPTPYKERKVTQQASRSPKKKQKKAAVVETQSEEEEFDSSRLRKKYKYIESEEALQWDECLDDSELTRVVAYSENLVPRDLPGSKGVTCRAAQAFNVQNDENVIFPSYIMGNLVVPPKGLKDSEAVGSCAQTFTVLSCQPKALEIAFGDPDGPEGVLDPKTAQRFLLRAGDMFRVTPGNCYRIKNHSKSKDAVLTWTIIRPFIKSGN